MTALVANASMTRTEGQVLYLANLRATLARLGSAGALTRAEEVAALEAWEGALRVDLCAVTIAMHRRG